MRLESVILISMVRFEIYFRALGFLLPTLVLRIFIIVSPSNLLGIFLFFVLIRVYVGFRLINAFYLYLLFIVYVGGLLVLLIYIIILSRNHILNFSPYSLSTLSLILLGSLLLWFFLGGNFSLGGGVNSRDINSSVEFSRLLLLGGVLTILFIYICNIILVGGRTLHVNKNS